MSFAEAMAFSTCLLMVSPPKPQNNLQVKPQSDGTRFGNSSTETLPSERPTVDVSTTLPLPFARGALGFSLNV